MEQKKSRFSFRFQLIVLLFLVVSSGVMLALSTGSFAVNFKDVGFSLISGVQKGANAVIGSVTGTVTAVRDLAQLQNEYDALKKELENYEYMQRTNATILNENKRLRELLYFSQSSQYKNITSQIIARDISGTYCALTLNKGCQDGIKKNMPVIAIQNGNIGLVGKIISVGRSTSMVMPVYDENCNVSVRIQHTRDIGIIGGAGVLDVPLSLKYIKKRVLDELQYGDIVVTSGENGNYIPNIAVGSISAIRILDYDTSLDIEVSPVINFSRLEYVMVVDTSALRDEE